MTQLKATRALIVPLIIALIVSAASQARAALIHQYRLDGSYADDFAGPSLVPAGGTLGPTSYSFAPNQGLSLSNGLPDAAEYSIEMWFSFSTVTSWRKILDFKDRSVDSGLYNLNTALQFYPPATGPSGDIQANVQVRVVVTRDEPTDVFTGYVDGGLAFSFTDGSGLGVFSATNNIIQFFKDDFATSQAEASAGVVDLIRIYVSPLSAVEVAELGGPVSVEAVPEPSTFVIGIGTLLMGLGYHVAKRKRAAK